MVSKENAIFFIFRQKFSLKEIFFHFVFQWEIEKLLTDEGKTLNIRKWNYKQFVGKLKHFLKYHKVLDYSNNSSYFQLKMSKITRLFVIFDVFLKLGLANMFKNNLKGTVKEKWKGLKANHFSSRSRPMKVISDVPISRNWFTTLWNLFRFKKIKFSK